jgi:hypothetical protein
MILRFSGGCHPRHKVKRLGEICEHKLFIERTINFLPRFCHSPTLGRNVKTGLIGPTNN